MLGIHQGQMLRQRKCPTQYLNVWHAIHCSKYVNYVTQNTLPLAAEIIVDVQNLLKLLIKVSSFSLLTTSNITALVAAHV